MKNHRFYTIAACSFLAIFAIVSVGSAMRESLTFDEIVHIQEGKNAIQKHEFLIDTNNPPLIREVAVIPLVLNTQRYISSKMPHMQALPARLVIITLGLALGGFIYIVSSKFFGQEVGLSSLFLYVFNPTLLAHSHYVTQDIGASLFFFLGYISLLWIMKERSWRSFVIHGICMGLMAASKITTIPYYIVSALLVVPYVLKKELFTWVYKRSIHIIASVSIFALVIWATYFFRMNVIVAPGDAQGRVSTTIKNIALRQHNTVIPSGLNFLQKQPVPLGDFIAVLKNTAIRSSKTSGIFFMGNTYAKPRWYFMPINMFFKTPLVLLLLGGFGLYGGLQSQSEKQKKRIVVMLIPIISILLVTSFSGMQPLVRYALPLFPFLAIAGGYSISGIKGKIGKSVLLILCGWYLINSFMAYPHYLSYTNEVSPPLFAFVDSNIDWGQSLVSFKDYIDTKKPSSLQFSYFGRDDAARYGFPSHFAFGSYKFNEICAFHLVNYPENIGPVLTAISLSNWYACGYNLDPKYSLANIEDIVAKSILIYK